MITLKKVDVADTKVLIVNDDALGEGVSEILWETALTEIETLLATATGNSEIALKAAYALLLAQPDDV